jgi:cyclopropane-fatty-acyl-phospholipid synthase
MVAGRAARCEADGTPAHERFVASLATSPVTLSPELANLQHYEVPVEFFRAVLGPRMKYSCAWFGPGVRGLAQAEEAMLALTAERAGIEDGMRVLDLGCGWGSLTLWLAERFPRCRITAVSNSKLQREAILAEAARRGCEDRVAVRTSDVARFEPGARFDRVASVEMVEHVRNWPALLERVASWLEPDGRLFVHHFAHRRFAYPYEIEGPGDWMARHFFTGGMMPSADLLARCDEHLRVVQRWDVDGLHYARTAEAWLRNLDRAYADLLRLLRRDHGDAAPRALGRWRLFFVGCAELFAFREGSEWGVTHQLLAPRRAGAAAR